MNRIAVSAIALMAASLCVSPAFAAKKDKPVNVANPNNQFVTGLAPQTNASPADNGFVCFAKYLETDKRRPVFSVGKLSDQTGKFSNEASAGGFEVTQGLPNMVYTALGKLAPDFAIVERTDTSIVDAEIGLAKQNLLGDINDKGIILFENGRPVYDTNGQPKLTNVGMRNLRGAQFLATDYYITGAITEINYNIDSGGAEFAVQGIGVGKRVFTMSVAMDLRVVDAKTLRVVKTVSERKIVRGYETKAGVFNFLGDYLIDINAGKKAQEPIELGVRSTMESGLLKLVGAVYGTNFGQQCSDYAVKYYGNVQPTFSASNLPAPGSVATNGDPIADLVAASK